MSTHKQNKRPIGQILLDGGFLSPRDLELALEEQRQTNELLGQVLVRMGVLDPTDLKAALSVQQYLNEPEDAVKVAAGARKMLGELLVQAGHITNGQLEQALVEQKKSGEKLGEVLVSMGLLTEKQLTGVLDFQQNQGALKPSPSPLRLGEILISAGYISSYQLEDALFKQTLSQKKLGEVLVEEGYAEHHHIHHGIRLQHMLLAAVLAGLLTACGGGMETQGGAPEPIEASQYQTQSYGNYLEVTSDDYGLMKPNFYYSTDNEAFWSIQANIAENVYDPNFRCVLRIDITKENGVMPDINKTFSIEDNPQYEKFPGTFFILSGQESSKKKVEHGLISFGPNSTASGNLTGSFDIVFTDYDSATVPAPQFHIKGNFGFKMGTYESAAPFTADISEGKV